MPRFNAQTLLAFQDELEKDAAGVLDLARRAGGYLARQGTTAGSGAALGGIAGAGMGAIGGGVGAYRQAREEGAGGGDAARAALSGTLGGVGKGLAAGAALGGAAGLAGGGAARGLVRRMSGGQGALSSVSRFGERQMHGLTGALPAGMGRAEGLKAMGMGSSQGLESLRAAEEGAKKFKGLKPADIADKATRKAAKKALGKEETAGKVYGHQKALEEMGATSVPGYLKAMATGNAGQVLKHSLGESWHGAGGGLGGWAQRGATFGLPAYMAGRAAMGPDDETMGRGQRAGQALGMAAMGLTGGVPIIGSMALSGLMGKVPEVAGKGVDALRNRAGKKGLEEHWQMSKRIPKDVFVPRAPEGEEGAASSQGVEHQYGSELRAMT